MTAMREIRTGGARLATPRRSCLFCIRPTGTCEAPQ